MGKIFSIVAHISMSCFLVFLLILLIPSKAPPDGSDGEFTRNDRIILHLCAKEKFKQDCACVDKFNKNSIPESKEFLKFILTGDREGALDYENRLEVKSKSKDPIASLSATDKINKITLDYVSISSACHSKPSIFHFLFAERKEI